MEMKKQMFEKIIKEFKKEIKEVKEDYRKVFNREIKTEDIKNLIFETLEKEEKTFKILDEKNYDDFIYFNNLYNLFENTEAIETKTLKEFINNGYLTDECLYIEAYNFFAEEAKEVFDIDVNTETIKYYHQYGWDLTLNFESDFFLIVEKFFKKIEKEEKTKEEIKDIKDELREELEDFIYKLNPYIRILIYLLIENKRICETDREEEEKQKRKYIKKCKIELYDRITTTKKEINKLEKEIKELETKTDVIRNKLEEIKKENFYLFSILNKDIYNLILEKKEKKELKETYLKELEEN